MADNFDLRKFLTENKLTKNAQLLNEADETQEAYALVIDEDGFFMQEDLTSYAQESYLNSEGEQLQNAEEVLNYPNSVAAWQHAPEQEQSQNEEWKAAVAKLGNTYDYYEVIGDGGENAVIAAIPQGSSLTDYIQDGYDEEDELEEAAPASMQAGFDMVSQEKRKHAEMMRVANKLFPQFGGQLVNFKPLTSQQREMVYQNLDPAKLREGIHDRDILSRPLSNPAIEPLEQSPEELGKAADARSQSILRAKYNRQIQDPNISDEELRYILSGKGVKGFGGTPNAVNNIIASRSTMQEAKSYKTSANSKEAQYLKKGDIIGSGDEVVSVSAGAKTPSGKVEVTLKTKDGKTKTSTWGKTTKVEVKAKETVKENKMTKRDQYLTRLVENALQIHPSDDDELEFNPADAADELDYRRDQYQGNQMEEADDMVEEKPMPKYENIEKLMQEIDKSTDEEAHKFKVQEMKRVADMLEKKCTGLEEGDNAEHIDQKKLKQMKKDIMSLRKGIEKMEKLGEKKFTKKETKAEMKEGFDLRKFLIENKMTTNSRMMKENSDMGEKMEFFMEFMQQYAAGMPEADILEILEGSYDIPQNVNMQVLERATSQLDLAINDIYTAIFESDNY